MPQVPAPVIGTDSNSPMMDPQSAWRMWDYDQLYMGHAGAGKYVPNVGDAVRKRSGRSVSFFTVVSISSSYTPQLEQDLVDATIDNPGQVDDLLDAARSQYPHLFKAYLNTSVRPYAMAVDNFLLQGGQGRRTARVFLGTDTSETGVVISRVYGPGNVFIGDTVELVEVSQAVPGATSLKYIPQFSVNVELQDDAQVTAVIYNEAGNVTGCYTLNVFKTGAVLPRDGSRRYITGIRLNSPLMSSPNSDVLNVPLGMPMSSLNLELVVEYTDGEQRFPVDNTTVQVFGLEEALALPAGASYPFSVRYKCSPGEYSAIATQIDPSVIIRPYRLNFTASDAAFGYKLLAFPEWVNAQTGYRLKWFLYNLARNLRTDVTQYVQLDTAAGDAYRPKGYGILQKLYATVDVGQVDVSLPSYKHVEQIVIVLDREGTARTGTNWQVGFSYNQTPRYGIDRHALAYQQQPGSWNIKVSQDKTNLQDWLACLYEATLPIFNSVLAANAPTPNWFALVINGVRSEYPISAWNQTLSFMGTVTNSMTMYVEFIRKEVDSIQWLSVVGMPTYHTDAAGNYL